MVAIAGAARVAHKLTVSTEEMYCTFGIKYPTGTGDPNLDDLALTHGEAFRDNILVLMGAGIHMIETVAVDLGDPTAALGSWDAENASAGSGTQPAPLAMAMVGTIHTAKRGKRYTGRTYIPGMPTSYFYGDGLRWADAGVSALQAGLDEYFSTTFSGEGRSGKLVVVSRSNAAFEECDHITVHNYFGSQRRRVNSRI